MDSDAATLLGAFERATSKFNLCPNRVWAVGQENLAKLMPKESINEGVNSGERNDHQSCTFDFCEYSQRDFTAVQQRHECEKGDCSQLQGLFSREILNKAADAEASTVWSLDGRAMVEHPQPYMAISHVWSDGTGSGAWQDGQVNECLYRFFEKIAKHFQCGGIWWDTICIPREKAARNKAIGKIQRNYEDARITLVHDCFLRNWNWDPETACFGILMSPWFSRGWTALELAKSRKVKVIFKGPHGLLVKDLDEEILAKEGGPDSPRKEASLIIRNLRHRSTSLNGLLAALGPRHTSWPKDRAIISQLLVDVKLQNTSQKDIWQQDIYKAILMKLRDVSSGHLFHNSATMHKVSWCPSNLFDMPTTDLGSSLLVTENLDIIGKWKRIPAMNIPQEKYTWRTIHPLMAARIKLHLQSNICFLLSECQTEPADQSHTGLIHRALLVKEITPNPPRYEYIGAVYFSPAIAEEDFGTAIDEIEAIISGDVERKVEPTENTHSARTWKRELYLGLTLETTGYHDAVWHGHRDRFLLCVKNAKQTEPDSLGQLPLHLASERGDLWMVHCLLTEAEKKNITQLVLGAKCAKGQTPLHRAAWAGSVAIVKLLKDEVNTGIYDNDGNSALHIAYEKGFDKVVDVLIDEHNCSAKNKNGETPLHYAARSGYLSTAKKLLERGADINAKDNCGWTPLHYASETGQHEAVKLLLRNGASINIKDNKPGWTPLHLAVISDRQGVIVELLNDRRAEVNIQDNSGWTPWQFAALKGHLVVMKLLLAKRPRENFTIIDGILWTPLHDASIKTQEGAIKLDTYGYTDIAPMNIDDWQLVSWAVKKGRTDVMRLLLDKGTTINPYSVVLAALRGHLAVVQLLLQHGGNVLWENLSPLLLSLLATESENIRRRPYWSNRFMRTEHMETEHMETEHRNPIEQWLIDNGAKRDSDDLKILQWAVSAGYQDIVQSLLNEGFGETGTDHFHTSLLWCAARNGHPAVVNLLLDNGYGVKKDVKRVLRGLFRGPYISEY